MDILYFFIMFAAFVALIVGLINPSIVMRWSKKPSRLKLIGWWLIVNFILLILIGTTIPEPTSQELVDSAKRKIEKENYNSALYDLNKIDNTDSLYAEAQSLIIKVDSLLTLQKDEICIKDEMQSVVLQQKQQSDSLKEVLQERVLREVEKFNVVYDEFEGITWLYSKMKPRYTNSLAFYTYIGLHDNGQFWRRLVVRYHGDDWLFLKSIIIKTDNNTYTLDASNAKRDNNADVWEWIDILVKDAEDFILYDVIHSKQTKIRFNGYQYHYDWSLPSYVIKGLEEIDDYYYLLDSVSKIK